MIFPSGLTLSLLALFYLVSSYALCDSWNLRQWCSTTGTPISHQTTNGHLSPTQPPTALYSHDNMRHLVNKIILFILIKCLAGQNYILHENVFNNLCSTKNNFENICKRQFWILTKKIFQMHNGSRGLQWILTVIVRKQTAG